MNNQSQIKLMGIALGGALLLMLFLLLKISLLQNNVAPSLQETTSLWVVFITGLTVGGFTCVAVQGGLLASVIAAKEEEEVEKGVNRKSTIFPTLAFLSTKLAAYTMLGFILGAFGGALNISPNVQIIMQFIAGVYMILIALNLLNVHPIFRYVVIQPPRFLTRMLRNQSKSKDLFAPAFLGAMTIFIPCGTTLAMEALAISSGNAFFGAAIMFTFILGTAPLFFGIGWLTSVLGDNFRGRFLKLAGLAVLYLGITSANGALVAGGSPISLPSITIDLSALGNGNIQQAATTNVRTDTSGVQVANMTVAPNGYFPNYFQVKSGNPVKMNLTTANSLGCTSVLRIPSLGIIKTLQKDSTDSVEFTPTSPGKIAFSCSMGMYRGVIEVI